MPDFTHAQLASLTRNQPCNLEGGLPQGELPVYQGVDPEWINPITKPLVFEHEGWRYVAWVDMGRGGFHWTVIPVDVALFQLGPHLPVGYAQYPGAYGAKEDGIAAVLAAIRHLSLEQVLHGLAGDGLERDWSPPPVTQGKGLRKRAMRL